MPEYFRFVRVTFDPSKYDAMMAYADTQVAKLKAVSGMRAVRVVRVADNQTITIGRYDSKEDGRHRQNKLLAFGLGSPSS